MRTWMGEGRIDDVRLRNTIEQFARTDRRISPALGNLAFIGRSVELGQIADHVCRKRQRLKNGLGGVSRRDQPVCTLVIEIAEVCQL